MEKWNDGARRDEAIEPPKDPDGAYILPGDHVWRLCDAEEFLVREISCRKHPVKGAKAFWEVRIGYSTGTCIVASPLELSHVKPPSLDDIEEDIYQLARGEAIDDPVHEVRSIMNKILRYNAVVK